MTVLLYFTMPQQTIIEYLLFSVALISVLLPMIGTRIGIPIFSVLGRWLRWFLFAGLFGFFMHVFELSFRPFWVHFLTGLTLWFLLETGYNWLAIKALSSSEIPLFPSFKINEDGDEWPADKQFITLREWLGKAGFKRLSALKAELFEETYLRASIYESADKLTRIQLLFIPKRKGGATACYTITSNGESDTRMITDNLFLPYGGYYPEGWNIVRKPLIGSLKRLYQLHQKRLNKSEYSIVAFENTPLEELNEQQRTLERLNLKIGFLVPRNEQEEVGKITYEGRYRIWKEMWLLAYLGRTVS